MIRIGANPIGWSNDDMLEIGGDIPLETCLKEAREAGFTGMELGNKFPREAAKLKPILDAHGHALVSGWYSTELLVRDLAAEMEAVKAHATLLRDMGCAVLIAAETSNAIHSNITKPLSARPVLPKNRWDEFGTRYTHFAEAVKAEYGLQLVYHHHMGTVVQSEAEIDRFCDAMLAIREEARAIADGRMDRENNPLKNAPHTVEDLVGEWDRPYSREQACYPPGAFRVDKYWSPVNRVDNVYGDRNLVCTCPPVEDYQQAAE